MIKLLSSSNEKNLQKNFRQNSRQDRTNFWPWYNFSSDHCGFPWKNFKLPFISEHRFWLHFQGWFVEGNVNVGVVETEALSNSNWRCTILNYYRNWNKEGKCKEMKTLIKRTLTKRTRKYKKQPKKNLKNPRTAKIINRR